MPTKKRSNGFMTKKSNPISVKRAYQISDSLKSESLRKKTFAAEQEFIGNAQIKNKVKPGQTGVSLYKETLGQPYPVGQQRLDIAKKYREEASKDSTNAARYKALADEAVRKSKLKTKKTK